MQLSDQDDANTQESYNRREKGRSDAQFVVSLK